MARPRKAGLDCFPHDTDAACDTKMSAFRAQHGNDAYVFFFILCERIYQTADAQLDISNPLLVASLAGKIMVTIERFHELLQTSLVLGLFDRDAYDQHGILTSRGIRRRRETAVDKRARWREKKGVINRRRAVKTVFPLENESFPPGKPRVFPLENPNVQSNVLKDLGLKDLELKDQELKSLKTERELRVPAHDQAPQPFAYEGNLDVWAALHHYGIKVRGFLRFEKIRAFQGVIADDLILAAIKASGNRSDAYCLKVLEDWHGQGWRQLADHPEHRPTEGGEVVALTWGRDRRTATAAAFEEAGRRSQSGKVVYQPRD